jgi:hypothetical protein
MNLWLKRIIYSIIISLLVLFIVADLLADYNEKFVIKSFRTELFSVDNGVRCYPLTKHYSLSDTLDSSKVILLTIRFKLKFINEKREHFILDEPGPDGGKGHDDKIVDVSFSEEKSFKNQFKNSMHYQHFTLGDSSIDNHHLSQEGCYEGRVYNSLQEFVDFYNSGKSKHYLYYLNDYHIFKITHSFAKTLLKSNARLSMSFSDGRMISSEINK